MIKEEIIQNGHRWINITEPDEEVADFVRDEFNVHPLVLEDILSKFEFPKIDAFDKYLFVILQFPIYDQKKNMYIRTELDVLLGKDFLVTINSGKLKPLQTFFEKCQSDKQARERFMDKGVALLFYEVVDSLFDHVFPFVNQKYDVIFRLEEDIFETQEDRDVIQDIMILKRDLINIRRIIAPQRAILHDIEKKYKNFIPEKLDIYFDDIVDKVDKITNQLETADKYVDVLQDANETIITRSTNRVIKTLTVISVTMLPLAFITSYYGMNVLLPFQNNPDALNYVNGLLVVVLLLMLGVFYKKRWLS